MAEVSEEQVATVLLSDGIPGEDVQVLMASIKKRHNQKAQTKAEAKKWAAYHISYLENIGHSFRHNGRQKIRATLIEYFMTDEPRLEPHDDL